MYLKSLKQAAWGLLGLSLTLSAGIHANGVTISDKHFISYKVSGNRNSIPFRNAVTLQDQFIPTPRDFNVSRAEWLLTPASKVTEEGIAYPNFSPLHYVGYRVSTSQPFFYDYTVNVYNQFGSFTLNAFQPEYLLVPSLKIRRTFERNDFIVFPTTFAQAIDDFADGDVVANANHYLCYRTNVLEKSSNYFGYLIDQFHPRFHGRRVYQALNTAHLCNPVVKSHDGRTYDIVDNEAHLLCFDFAPQWGYGQLTFAVANQFGRGVGNIFSDDEVCVPSSKQIIPDLCEGSLNNNGTCNGTCPIQGYLCQPNIQDLTRCHCVPGPSL